MKLIFKTREEGQEFIRAERIRRSPGYKKYVRKEKIKAELKKIRQTGGKIRQTGETVEKAVKKFPSRQKERSTIKRGFRAKKKRITLSQAIPKKKIRLGAYKKNMFLGDSYSE